MPYAIVAFLHPVELWNLRAKAKSTDSLLGHNEFRDVGVCEGMENHAYIADDLLDLINQSSPSAESRRATPKSYTCQQDSLESFCQFWRHWIQNPLHGRIEWPAGPWLLASSSKFQLAIAKCTYNNDLSQANFVSTTAELNRRRKPTKDPCSSASTFMSASWNLDRMYALIQTRRYCHTRSKAGIFVSDSADFILSRVRVFGSWIEKDG